MERNLVPPEKSWIKLCFGVHTKVLYGNIYLPSQLKELKERVSFRGYHTFELRTVPIN